MLDLRQSSGPPEAAPKAPFDLEVRVVASRALSPCVRELELARLDGRAFVFEPGQSLDLLVPSPVGERRTYSIASIPSDSPNLRIAVAIKSRAGAVLAAVSAGAHLHASGPRGSDRQVSVRLFLVRRCIRHV